MTQQTLASHTHALVMTQQVVDIDGILSSRPVAISANVYVAHGQEIRSVGLDRDYAIDVGF